MPVRDRYATIQSPVGIGRENLQKYTITTLTNTSGCFADARQLRQRTSANACRHSPMQGDVLATAHHRRGDERKCFE